MFVGLQVYILGQMCLGYFGKRSGFLPDAAEAHFGAFVGRVALPCLLFNALAKLNFVSANWTVIGVMILVKTILAFLGLALGRLSAPKGSSAGARLQFMGLCALFLVNDDATGTGVPAFEGQPQFAEFAPLLYLFAAMNMILLLPPLFVVMGVGQRLAQCRTRSLPCSPAH